MGNGQAFFITQVMVKLANTVYMAVYGLGSQSVPHQVINVARDR